MAIPDPPPAPQFVPPVGHSLVGVNVGNIKELLNHLRTVRDKQTFKAEGAHNFREWAMNIGHRRAPQRIGFLLLEFEARQTIRLRRWPPVPHSIHCATLQEEPVRERGDVRPHGRTVREQGDWLKSLWYLVKDTVSARQP